MLINRLTLEARYQSNVFANILAEFFVAAISGRGFTGLFQFGNNK
ncbi:hypothetical protein XBKQ1_430006 [Xenorhabdus bovienii str. kraussei Quebec]|uniref:Uncharacterized protein n=2 Tax=Xenorhabdus bovienii TaxID=40576 RepID=A0A077PK77_XENBV|nr:hypothetical protein XBKQ1_430006 [Xenorhabdus bovienii str. kraussei Quebec]CDH33015.1 hypothetical protein XBI1_2310006 [Xenorhabdus bovienii str. Intermedium]